VYVCLCKGLTESDVRRVSFPGIATPETIVAAFGLEDEECCGRCARNIYELVSIATGTFVCGPSDGRSACADRCHGSA